MSINDNIYIITNITLMLVKFVSNIFSFVVLSCFGTF